MTPADGRTSTRTRPRVARACDRCRVKKAKCDGEKPCQRCSLDRLPCLYRLRATKIESARTAERQTALNSEYVAILSDAIYQLYKLLSEGHGWTGSAVEDTHGNVCVHKILEQLGLLDQDRESESGNISDSDTKSNSATCSSPLKPSHQNIAPKPRPPARHAPRRKNTRRAQIPPLVPSSPFTTSPATTITPMSGTSTNFNPANSMPEQNAVNRSTAFVPQMNLPPTPLSSHSPLLSLRGCSDGHISGGTAAASWQAFPPDGISNGMFTTTVSTTVPVFPVQQYEHPMQQEMGRQKENQPTHRSNYPPPQPYRNPSPPVSEPGLDPEDDFLHVFGSDDMPSLIFSYDGSDHQAPSPGYAGFDTEFRMAF